MTDEQLTLEHPEKAVGGEGGAEEERSAEEIAKEKLKAALKVQTEPVGTLRVKMTVAVPRDLLNERLGEQFNELKRDALVPGFRKGRAPVRLIEKRFGHDVGDELVSKLLGGSYLIAVEKENLKPIGDPLIWVKARDESLEKAGRHNPPVDRLVTIENALDHLHMPSEGDFTYSCEVELRPKFELPKLEGIPIKRPNIKVTDDDITEELRRLRARRGNWAPAEDGMVGGDDLLYADVKITVDDQVLYDEANVPFAPRNQVFAGVHLATAGEALVGRKVGDRVTLQGDVAGDHERLDVRGKGATVEVTIQEIKRLALPEANQEFFESLGFEDEKEYRTLINRQLSANVDAVMQRALHGQISKYLLEHTELEVPAGLSQRQMDWVIRRRMAEVYERGLTAEEIDKDSDRLRTEARDQAILDLKIFFIMERIAEDLKVEVPDEELNGAIAQIAARRGQRFDRTRDELARENGLEGLYLQLRDAKILDALLEKAEITEVEGPPAKEAPKKAKASPGKRTAAKKKPKDDSADET